jgi:hypothetical protein
MARRLRSLPGKGPHHGDGHPEAMLSGKPLPENANAELQGVHELLTALRAAPVDPVDPGRLPRDVRQVPPVTTTT